MFGVFLRTVEICGACAKMCCFFFLTDVVEKAVAFGPVSAVIQRGGYLAWKQV